jgi:small subunit ribosomal protein S2
MLEKAEEYIAGLAKEGKKILFIGTKKQAKELVKKAAVECNMPYVIERWPGGAFTNFKTIKKQIQKLKDLRIKEKTGEFAKYTKKEQILIKDEIERLEKLFGGLTSMEELPDAIFIVNSIHDFIPLREARKMKIPVISMVDTNADPEVIDYPIPANDDAIKSIELICNLLSEAVKDNYKEKIISSGDYKVKK